MAPNLISYFRGSLAGDDRQNELQSADYATPDGFERIFDWIKVRVNVADYNLETEAFEKYFHVQERERGKLSFHTGTKTKHDTVDYNEH